MEKKKVKIRREKRENFEHKRVKYSKSLVVYRERRTRLNQKGSCCRKRRGAFEKSKTACLVPRVP